MDDPNKSAKEAFQKMLECGQLSSSAYLPSRLQLQRAVWQLQKENTELKRKIDELERTNKTRIKNNSKDSNAGRLDDFNHVEVKG
jgi:hypothetical protein